MAISFLPDITTTERFYNAAIYLSEDREEEHVLLSAFADQDLQICVYRKVITKEQFFRNFRECDKDNLDSTKRKKAIRCIKITPGDLDDSVEVREVDGFDNRFLVTETGNVLSKRSRKFLRQHTNQRGYKVLATYVGGRRGKALCPRAHRLVALAFIPNPENKPEVNHIDGNKVNNHRTNLEWATGRENYDHSINTGLYVVRRGVDAYGAKLTTEQVIELRKKFRSGTPVSALVKEYKINKTKIYDCINRKSYKEIP